MEKNRSEQSISRRATLRLLGVAGASAFVGLAGGRVIERLPFGRRGMSSSAGATSCVVRPALTEGPYFVDERLNRSDIRTDPTTGALRPGVQITAGQPVMLQVRNPDGQISNEFSYTRSSYFA